MSIADVKNEILADSTAKAAAIIAQARSQRDKRFKEAENELERELSILEAESQASQSQLEQRQLASAEFSSKISVLIRKKELIASLRQEVEKQLGELSQKERKQVIDALIKKAKAKMQIETIQANEQDIKLVDGYTAVAAPIIGGVIAQNKEERIDLSYGTLLDEVFEAKLKHIVEELFA